MTCALDLLVDMLQRFEGCRLHAYRDEVGVWTIGWGETFGVHEGDVWTQGYADAMLRTRASQFLLATFRACPRLLSEPVPRQAACGSLAYNIGVGAFRASSVCRKTARKDYAGAAESFLLWNKAGGRVSRVLSLRRVVERASYLT